MPFFTLTIEDYSPFITYSGTDWRSGTSANYSQSIFRQTNTGGANAKIAFNGTGITIYGAKRSNHGQYLVNVDGQNNSPVNGSASPDQFNQALFTVSDLAQGLHTVQITNQNDGYYLDIDYITIQGNIGASTSEQLYVFNYQDSDGSFSYQPPSQWSTSPDNIGTFFGASGHSTSSSQASFEFSFRHSSPRAFQGNGVSLYGPLSANGAPYTVSLDGSHPITLQSSSDRYIPQALLFHANNIGVNPHHLKVTCGATGNNQTFAVDYANVYTDNPDLAPGSSTNSTSSSAASPNKSSGLSAGAAAGIAVAACVTAACVSVFLFFLMRRRKQRQAEEKMKEERALINPYPGAPVSYLPRGYTPMPSESGATSSDRTNFHRETPSPAPVRKLRMDAGSNQATGANEIGPPGYSV